MAQTISRMGCFLSHAIVRTRAADERAEPLTLASHGSFRLAASRPTKALDLLAPLPDVMASEAVAFFAPTEFRAFSSATFLYVARPSLH